MNQIYLLLEIANHRERILCYKHETRHHNKDQYNPLGSTLPNPQALLPDDCNNRDLAFLWAEALFVYIFHQDF